MAPRLLHFSDLENAFDRPERVGRLAGTLAARRTDDHLVVGTGDNTAPGVLAMETEGRQALPFYRAVAPDAETFGNHDFDFGLGAARSLVADSGVEWLSTNVRDGDGPFAGAAPTAVHEVGGERVALVGVTDPETPVPDTVTVTDPVEAVRAACADLPAVDRVVLLAHVGDPLGEDLARETPADVVLAGHTHAVDRERVGDALLVRPGENGELVWEVDLGGDRPTATRHDVADGPLDEAVAADLREQLAEHGLADAVARVETPVVRDRSEFLRGESRLGNYATDAIRWATGAEVGHLNTLALREGPPLGPDVTVADLRGIAPFHAPLYACALPGERLDDLVAESLEFDGIGRHDGPVWTGLFSGLTVRLDRATGDRTVLVGGDPLDPDRTYRVGATAYVVHADSFETLTPDDVVSDHRHQDEAFVDYARETGFDPATDGRIAYVDE